MLTDKELIELVRLDKDAGFRKLMSIYQEKIYWHIRQMVTYHDDADDVVQNTFIKVYRYLDNFKEWSSLYTWIYRIATNESLSFLKKRKKQASDSIDNEELMVGQRLKADEYFDGNEVNIKLQQAILGLPEKQKAVFQLRYYQEMPYQQISEILDTSVGALKASYHHAVKKIEKYLKNED